MRISASVRNSFAHHEVSVQTNDNRQTMEIAPKATGFGSSVNGGELLFLALATCYCNDIYREAAKRSIRVERVEVEVNGDFGGEGDPALRPQLLPARRQPVHRPRLHQRRHQAPVPEGVCPEPHPA